MRHIGHLPGGQARVFSDYLVSRGIRNEVEREQDGTYAIWIREEDQVTEAAEHLKRFTGNPNASDFSGAAADAEKVRLAEKADALRPGKMFSRNSAATAWESSLTC
jgi:hypothetical protein